MKLRLFSLTAKKPDQVHAEQTSEAILARPRTVLQHRKLVVRRVVGESMYPTLQEGELVIALQRRQLAPDDIVIFRHKGLEKIKRVREVDAARVYVVGDNPRYSTDSRHYGMVPLDDVLGKVVWPRQRD